MFRRRVRKSFYLVLALCMAFQPLFIQPANALNPDELDTKPPSVPTNGQPHDAFKADTSFSFHWDPSVDELSPVAYQLRASRDDAQVSAWEDKGAWYSAELSENSLPASKMPLTDGTWYWQVRARDTAGNTSEWSEVWSVHLKTAGPAIHINQPLEGVMGNTTVPFSAIITDAHKMSSIVVELDGQDITQHIARTQHETSLHLQKEWLPGQLSDGVHILKVAITDSYGQSSALSRLFTLDVSPPEITVNMPEGQVLKGVATLRLDANEPGTYTIRITDESGELLSQGGAELHTEDVSAHTRVWDTWQVPDGTYTLTFTGRDKAGNESVLTRKVIVSNTLVAGVITKDPLLEELSAALGQPLPTPQEDPVFTSTSSTEVPKIADISPQHETLLGSVPKFTPVVATENGWQLFGVLWYWWMLGGVVVALSISYVKRLIRASFQQLPGQV